MSFANAEFERQLTESVERILGRRRRVEHRPVVLPAASLSSPKLTEGKMQGEGRCRLCPRRADLTRHHVVPHSWFLGQPEVLRKIRNAHANIVPLCRACHDEVDSRHPVAREMARQRLRDTFSQQEIAFVIAVRGKLWLDLKYPPAVG